MARVKWPPTPERAKYNVKLRSFHRSDGEPIVLPLKRWPNDRTTGTNHTVVCCDCGLEHKVTYSVLHGLDNKWYLVVRAYRLNQGKMRCRRPHLKRRKRS